MPFVQFRKAIFRPVACSVGQTEGLGHMVDLSTTGRSSTVLLSVIETSLMALEHLRELGAVLAEHMDAQP